MSVRVQVSKRRQKNFRLAPEKVPGGCEATCDYDHIVKKFENTGEDTDDLISIGTVGLIKGIDTFNTERGTRLATYAARCIENEILMHLRVTKRRRSEVSIYDPIGYDREGNEIMLVGIT